MLKIFADRHHDGLAFSLRLLAKRLGAELYFPIGEEWFTKGYWNVARPYGDNPSTVKQFLQIKPEYKHSDSPILNTILEENSSYYAIQDHYHGDSLKAITFAQFIDMDIDVIIASIPDHWYTYKRLIDQYKPKAKLVMHMGNMFNEIAEALHSATGNNLMASTIPFKTPSFINTVFYYQEQPLVPFTPSLPYKQRISSYAHVMPKKELFEQYKTALPTIKMNSFGAANSDGWMASLSHLYTSMQNDMFVWHVKPGGDGYGWNWHSAYMLGRPVITNFSDYKDKLGGKLFIDGQTGIDLEARSFEDNVKLIKEILANGDRLKEMQQMSRSHFMNAVNYEIESEKLRVFFETLV